ncbi:MAG: Na+/H+ antiporter subunit E [Ilumatobacteraceae bacterium]
MRTLYFVVGLAVIWVVLWGAASVANIASGIVVATAIVFVVPGLRKASPRRWPIVRPLAVIRLGGYVLRSTVTSNVVLTREVLSRGSQIRTGVVGVPLPQCSDELLTLITNLLALAPGTMPLEVVHDPTELYVHVLHLGDIEAVRVEILHLTDLVMRAFGANDELAGAQNGIDGHGGAP